MSGVDSVRPIPRTYSRGKVSADKDSDDFDLVKETVDAVPKPKAMPAKSTWGRRAVKKKEPVAKPVISAASPYDWEDSPDEFSPSKNSLSPVTGLAKKRRAGGSSVVSVSLRSSVSVKNSVKNGVSVTSSVSLKSNVSVSASVAAKSTASCMTTFSDDFGSSEDSYASTSTDCSQDASVKSSRSTGELTQNGFNGLIFSKHTKRTAPNHDTDVAELIYNNSEEDDSSCPSSGSSHPLKRSLTVGAASGSPMRSIVEEIEAPSDRLLAARRNITPALTSSGGSSTSLRVPSLTKAASWPRVRSGATGGSRNGVPSKMCKRSEKPLFTVVSNVCDATETQEQGENQSLMDDLHYSMDGLLSTSPLPVRCLSCCNLASQAASPAFRQALRSSSATTTLFSRLQDAPKSKSLALCTASIFYMLSRDRFSMDLDKNGLELLVQLLRCEKDSDWTASKKDDEKQYGKMQMKIRVLLQNPATRGGHHLDLDNLTASQLACEALLALMSSLVGAAHRDNLRTFGGLRRLIGLVTSYTNGLPDGRHCVAYPDNVSSLLDRISRPVHVLADAVLKDRSANAYEVRDSSRHNRQNQAYIIQCNQGAIFSSLTRVVGACSSYVCQSDSSGTMPSAEDKSIVMSALSPVLRLLVSLTHEQESNDVEACDRAGLLESVLRCIIEVPKHVDLPEEKQINLVLQAACLLLNFSMHSWSVQSTLASLRPAWLAADNSSNGSSCEDSEPMSPVVALVVVCEQYQAAASAYDLDALLDSRLAALKAAVAALPAAGSHASPDASPAAIGGSETAESVANSREQAYSHMQRSLVAAYVAMLVGLLAQSSASCRLTLCNALSADSLDNMLKLLSYFLSFMRMTNMANETELELITGIVKMLEGFSSKVPAASCIEGSDLKAICDG